MKTCKSCNQTKLTTEFYSNKAKKDKLATYCKDCHRTKNKQWAKEKPKDKADARRRWHLKNKYGITLEDYDTMLEAQNYSCAICKTDTPKTGGTGPATHFAVDHSHRTGKVRGLLCHSCNTSLGHFKDDIGLLQAAIAYLGVSATI